MSHREPPHQPTRAFRILSLASTCLSILIMTTLVQLTLNWLNAGFEREENVYFFHYPNITHKYSETS